MKILIRTIILALLCTACSTSFPKRNMLDIDDIVMVEIKPITNEWDEVHFEPIILSKRKDISPIVKSLQIKSTLPPVIKDAPRGGALPGFLCDVKLCDINGKKLQFIRVLSLMDLTLVNAEEQLNYRGILDKNTKLCRVIWTALKKYRPDFCKYALKQYPSHAPFSGVKK